MERRNHYAEIQEKRLSKEHDEMARFAIHDEKDKGMLALKQLEFMKVKIEKINHNLRTSYDKHKIDQIKINQKLKEIEDDKEELEYLPEQKMNQS